MPEHGLIKAVLNKLGKYEEGLKDIDKALQSCPTNIYIMNHKGAVLLKLKRYEALICLDMALNINPNDAVARFNKAVHLNNLRRYKEAVENYDMVIQIGDNLFRV